MYEHNIINQIAYDSHRPRLSGLKALVAQQASGQAYCKLPARSCEAFLAKQGSGLLGLRHPDDDKISQEVISKKKSLLICSL